MSSSSWDRFVKTSLNDLHDGSEIPTYFGCLTRVMNEPPPKNLLNEFGYNQPRNMNNPPFVDDLINVDAIHPVNQPQSPGSFEDRYQQPPMRKNNNKQQQAPPIRNQPPPPPLESDSDHYEQPAIKHVDDSPEPLPKRTKKPQNKKMQQESFSEEEDVAPIRGIDKRIPQKNKKSQPPPKLGSESDDYQPPTRIPDSPPLQKTRKLLQPPPALDSDSDSGQFQQQQQRNRKQPLPPPAIESDEESEHKPSSSDENQTPSPVQPRKPISKQKESTPQKKYIPPPPDTPEIVEYPESSDSEKLPPPPVLKEYSETPPPSDSEENNYYQDDDEEEEKQTNKSLTEQFREISDEIYDRYWYPLDIIIPRLNRDSRLMTSNKRSKYPRIIQNLATKFKNTSTNKLRFSQHKE